MPPLDLVGGRRELLSLMELKEEDGGAVLVLKAMQNDNGGGEELPRRQQWLKWPGVHRICSGASSELAASDSDI